MCLGLIAVSSLLSLMVPLTVNMASVRVGLIAMHGVLIAQITRFVYTYFINNRIYTNSGEIVAVEPRLIFCKANHMGEGIYV